MLEVPDVDFIVPCGVLVLLCFNAVWTCVVVGVMLVVCILSVFLFPCLLVLCVFMFDCVGELFVECVCYLCR